MIYKDETSMEIFIFLTRLHNIISSTHKDNKNRNKLRIKIWDFENEQLFKRYELPFSLFKGILCSLLFAYIIINKHLLIVYC